MANYSKIKDHEAEVLALKAEGWTNQAIAEHFGFSGKKAVKEFFVRKNRREREGPKVTIPKQRGRPRKTPLTSITADLYTHVLPDTKQSEIKKLSDTIKLGI